MKRNIALMLALVLMLCCASALANDYDYEKKHLWYDDSAAVQALRDPPIWNNLYDLFSQELAMSDPLYHFDMVDFIDSPKGEALIENLEPIVLFEDEMGEDLLAYWAEKGIRKDMHNADGEGIKYAVYTPVEAFESGETYPLMVLMSGGSDPIFTAEAFGVSAYGAQAKYITMIPQSREPEEMIEVINAVLDEYPVDASRIYVTGNGGGVRSAVKMLVNYPEYFAAASPFGASWLLSPFKSTELYMSVEEFEDQFINRGMQLPVQVVDGTASLKEGLPINVRYDGQREAELSLWLEINDVVFPEINNTTCVRQITYSDKPANHYTGLDFTHTWELTLDTEYYLGEFYDTKGVPMFRMCVALDGTHWPTAGYPEMIWNFCSMYSRDLETGAIIYEP